MHLAHIASILLFNNHIITCLILTYNLSYVTTQILFHIIFYNRPCHQVIKEMGSLMSLVEVRSVAWLQIKNVVMFISIS